jgi:hypothetical protein
MNGRKFASRVGFGFALIGIGAGAGLAPTHARERARSAQACVPSNNIEAIIDDSGSMAGTDPGTLRSQGVKLFITQVEANGTRKLGAVEFGSNADTVILPLQIALSSRDTMEDALDAKIAANGAMGATGVDDGFATDYNAGFARGNADNPTATARIFLTDGAHNEGPYTNSHLPGPPTYVIGLGIGPASAEDPNATRLQQIADDTGGRYFPGVVDTNVQPTFTTVSALVDCQPEPEPIAMPLFSSVAQSASRSFTPRARARRVSLVVNWAVSGNEFALFDVKALGRRGRVVATQSGRGRPRKLRIRKESGETFQSWTIRRSRQMLRLRFKVRPKELSESETPIVQARSILAR